MSIGELCSREVICISRNESAGDAARLMREHHIGSVVVVDRTPQGPRPVGMVTDRDIAVGVVAPRLDAEKIPVEGVMRPGVACIEESEGVGRAVALMRSEGVRRLAVVDAGGSLVGLLAADDLLDLLGEEMQGLAGMLAKGMTRERQERRAQSTIQ
jgi:CBS domain-containing protein